MGPRPLTTDQPFSIAPAIRRWTCSRNDTNSYSKTHSAWTPAHRPKAASPQICALLVQLRLARNFATALVIAQCHQRAFRRCNAQLKTQPLAGIARVIEKIHAIPPPSWKLVFQEIERKIRLRQLGRRFGRRATLHVRTLMAASVIILTNLEFAEWVLVFGNPKMITTLLDRVAYYYAITEPGNTSHNFAQSKRHRKT